RHLHLSFLGRWPGKQYGLLGADRRVQAYYRLRECQDDEFCGCGSETRRYSECCKPSDLQWDTIEVMGLFLRHIEGGFQSRRPPPYMTVCVDGKGSFQKIVDVHLQMSSH